MAFDTLRHLYVRELQDLYSVETQLVKALPRMAKSAHSPELKSALTDHLEQTREHARRLETLLNELGAATDGPRSKPMAALIREGQSVAKEGGTPSVVDAGLITAAQKIEHYEISGYGSARTYANMLRDDRAADLLQQTLNEEGTADELLSELAEATLSVEAESGRLDDIAMHGDTEPGGVDQASYSQALRNEQPPSRPLEGGGTGAHWEEGQPARTDPVSGERPDHRPNS